MTENSKASLNIPLIYYLPIEKLFLTTCFDYWNIVSSLFFVLSLSFWTTTIDIIYLGIIKIHLNVSWYYQNAEKSLAFYFARRRRKEIRSQIINLSTATRDKSLTTINNSEPPPSYVSYSRKLLSYLALLLIQDKSCRWLVTIKLCRNIFKNKKSFELFHC